jgi:uncharacterized RDD family membrane protein YckC
MSMGSGQPPGWYPAHGDPPGTHRYWDGTQWVGGPQPIGGPSPFGTAPMGFPTMPAPAAAGPGGRPLADPGTRIVARLIDLVIGIGIAFVVAVIVGVDDRIGLQLFVALVGIVYEVAFTALKGGTPGKMIMGIGVITTAGTYPPGWGPAVIRWVVTAIPCIGIVVFIVSFVFLFTDPSHRTVGDKAANTLVVKTR